MTRQFVIDVDAHPTRRASPLAAARRSASELEAHVDDRGGALAAIGEPLEHLQGPLEERDRLAVVRAGGCPHAGLTEVVHRTLPQVAVQGVMGEPLDLLARPLAV